MAKIKKKAARTQMKTQEDIRSIAESVADVYRSRRNQFNAALTLIAIVILGAIAFSMLAENKEKKASEMLDGAYLAAGRGGAAPANYPLALQRFQDVAKQYGGTLSGAVARFEAGNTYAQMGQYEPALREYQKCVTERGKDRFLVPFVYQRMGYAYLALGKHDDAVSAFSKAESVGGAGPATVELARLYDQAGNMAEAIKKYKEVSEKLSSTSWAVEARVKLPPPVMQAPATAPAETAR